MTTSDPFPAGGRDDLQVSVVMPAFNEADILEGTVSDVVEGMRSRHQPFEVIVCENGSTDGTLALARGLAEKYPEVVVIHLARADYGAALHAGLLAARGEAVVNFDVDFYDLAFLDAAVARVRAVGGPACCEPGSHGPRVSSLDT